MLSKKDAETSIDANERAQYEALEKSVDKALEKYDGRPVDVPVNASLRVASKLKEAYTEGGWTVTRHTSSDPLAPGPFLRFA